MLPLQRGAKGPVDLCSAQTEAERRQATYDEIKKYVAVRNDGMKVSKSDDFNI